jgi:hypothetical protein
MRTPRLLTPSRIDDYRDELVSLERSVRISRPEC